MNEFKLKAPYKPNRRSAPGHREIGQRDLKKATSSRLCLVLLAPVRLSQWRMSLPQLNKPTLVHCPQ